jgi:hypothetical protein
VTKGSPPRWRPALRESCLAEIRGRILLNTGTGVDGVTRPPADRLGMSDVVGWRAKGESQTDHRQSHDEGQDTEQANGEHDGPSGQRDPESDP